MSESRRLEQSKALVGKAAPRIALQDHEGKAVDLTMLRGKRILLSFHPLAWTRVCALQMQALEAHAGELEAADSVAFGVSVDPSPSKKAWAESLGIVKTRLLSDFWPHGAVAQALGLFHDKEGFSDRAALVLDEQGVIRFAKVYAIPELPDIDEQIRALRAI